MELQTIQSKAKQEIKLAGDAKTLDLVFKKYLGKQGELTRVLRSLKNLPEKDRKKTGELANKIKLNLNNSIEIKSKKFQVSGVKQQDKQFDITIPGKKLALGHLHPLTQIERNIVEIFKSMGFSIAEGPEVETEYYNFDALNMSKDHPARDMWDTFWLKNSRTGKQGSLLRTHTSPVQVRYMEKNNPPLRIIVPGRCFRHEATDSSHEVQLYHVEGLMIDKNVSVANFKAIIREFLKAYFGKSVDFRLRPSFFPFTEPSFEIDIKCLICGGKGCSTCSKTGWLEMMGAGMVHPNVFKAAGYNPKHWQGIAFGMGMDRLAMMKYKIDDIRLFHAGDLRFLNQF